MTLRRDGEFENTSQYQLKEQLLSSQLQQESLNTFNARMQAGRCLMLLSGHYY